MRGQIISPSTSYPKIFRCGKIACNLECLGREFCKTPARRVFRSTSESRELPWRVVYEGEIPLAICEQLEAGDGY